LPVQIAFLPSTSFLMNSPTRETDRGLPTLLQAGALCLFIILVALPLRLASHSSHLNWLHRHLFFTSLAFEWLLLLCPALLSAWWCRWRWADTFSWHWPGPLVMFGGFLMAVGALSLASLAELVQNRYFPSNPRSAIERLEFILQILQQHPVSGPLLLAGTAGICEELLFRGPIQTSLLRRMPPWAALLLGGFFFALVHNDATGLLGRTFLGVVLGWMVYRTGSIFPALLAHFTIDAVAFFVFSSLLRKQGMKALLHQYRAGTNAHLAITAHSIISVFISGSLLMALGAFLCCSGRSTAQISTYPPIQ
jgi:membrane protease YdiL (CAAX protease family)